MCVCISNCYVCICLILFFMFNCPGNFVVMVMEQSGHILGPRDSLMMPVIVTLLFTLGFPPLGLIKYKTVDI